ncbi:MAG: hypothetical protein AB7D51_00545 [Desulfovibrionaceae bacterium]
MRNIVFTIIFLAVLVGAGYVVNATSIKTDMPYEAGLMTAPVVAGHGHGHEEGHGEAGHEEGHDAHGAGHSEEAHAESHS